MSTEYTRTRSGSANVISISSRRNSRQRVALLHEPSNSDAQQGIHRLREREQKPLESLIVERERTRSLDRDDDPGTPSALEEAVFSNESTGPVRHHEPSVGEPHLDPARRYHVDAVGGRVEVAQQFAGVEGDWLEHRRQHAQL